MRILRRFCRRLCNVPLWWFIIGILFLCALWSGLSWLLADDWQEAPDQTALSPALLGKKIVIDAGHGGFDPGAVGVEGTLEKDVNLAIAARLADYLRQSGAEIFETRVSDDALADTKKADMAARVQMATDNQAELFVSVQANAIPQAKWHGAQVFYYREGEEGKGLAQSIQAAIIEQLANTDRTALPIDSIYVVSHLNIPSIVVEVGFLSNPEEEQLLNDPEYQNAMAYAIYCGIAAYYSDAADLEIPNPSNSDTANQ